VHPSRSAILTGRYAIRSGTHSVPFGGVADGLTQWEVTMANRCRPLAMRRRYTENGTSAVTMAACPMIRDSTSGTASPHDRRGDVAGVDGLFAKHHAA